MSRIRLQDHHKTLLIELYSRTRKSLDDLPYTEAFESLHASFLGRSGMNLSRHELWMAIVNLRKAGRLGRKQRVARDEATDSQEAAGQTGR